MSRPFGRTVTPLPTRRRHGGKDIKDIQDIKQEVKGLRDLRLIAGKAQADVATVLRIKQPSVSKVENQADMYLSTLRAYVEAIGGKLDLIVRLPGRPMPRVFRLSDALGQVPPSRSGAAVRRRSAATAGRGTSGR
jgi:Helix-turn-helix domain